MKRFIDFLSDRRNLCKFYLYAMMVIIAVVPFFFEQGTDLSFFYTIMRLGYCAWTAFILIGDLVHHQVPPGLLSRSSAALTAAACLSLIFGARAPSAGQIAGIGYLIMTSYVVVSIGYYYSDSFSEDFDPILRLLATELFLLISVSLVMFLLPEWLEYSSWHSHRSCYELERGSHPVFRNHGICDIRRVSLCRRNYSLFLSDRKKEASSLVLLSEYGSFSSDDSAC